VQKGMPDDAQRPTCSDGCNVHFTGTLSENDVQGIIRFESRSDNLCLVTKIHLFFSIVLRAILMLLGMCRRYWKPGG